MAFHDDDLLIDGDHPGMRVDAVGLALAAARDARASRLVSPSYFL